MGHIEPAPGSEAYNYQKAHWDDDIRAQSIVGCLVPAVAMTLLFFIRIIHRLTTTHKLTAADWLIIAAWPFGVALCVASVYPISSGMGTHQLRVILEDQNPPTVLRGMFITAGYIGPIFWTLGMTFTKLSLIFYYREIFYVQQKTLNYIIWFLVFYVTAWGIGTFFTNVFKCEPIRWNFDAVEAFYGITPTYKGHCQPELAHLAAPTFLNTASDIALIILPAVMLVQLQMSYKRKIAIAAVFSVGLFTVGVGIARIVFLFQVNNESDFTWNNVNSVVWITVELSTGMLCACIPPAAPFLRELLVKMRILPPSQMRSYGNSKPSGLGAYGTKTRGKPQRIDSWEGDENTERELQSILYPSATKSHARSASFEVRSSDTSASHTTGQAV